MIGISSGHLLLPALLLQLLAFPSAACWTKNGLLVCHSDSDCEENAKCHAGWACTCQTERGTCACLDTDEVEKEREQRESRDRQQLQGGSEVDVEVDRAFAIADKDHDGFITHDEALSSLADGTSASDQVEFIKSIDADGDGRISRAELQASLTAYETSEL